MDGWFHFSKHSPVVMAATWSLGVEEKYYLLWPWIVRSVSPRVLLPITLCVVLCDQALHLWAVRVNHDWGAYGFAPRLDGILLGSALALAAYLGWRPKRWMLRPWMLWLAIAAIMLCAQLPWLRRVGIGITLGTYPILLVLIYCMTKPPRVLNNAVARFFGQISYSLYLYHLLAIYCVQRFYSGRLRYALPASVLLALAFAVASYFVVERPCNRLRKRREFVKTG